MSAPLLHLVDKQNSCNPAFHILEAHIALTQDNTEQAGKAIAQAMELCKAHGFTCLDLLNRKVVTDILEWAITQDICNETVNTCMAYFNLEPNDTAYPPLKTGAMIKVYTLGQFAVEVSGKFIDNRHAKSKPYELLKAVIAMGGRQVSQEKLIEALWPDAEGDAARRNFDTTLHRLRKLLMQNDVLVLKDSMLTLNANYVWVDVWAVERLLGELKTRLNERKIHPKDIQSLVSKLFVLYRGDYLAHESDRSWSIVLKERLRIRLLNILLQTGRCWQKLGDYQRALDCFERGLYLDPLHEPYYQHLMQLHLENGKAAETIKVYEKCRQVLSTTLGVMPSSQSIELYNQARA